MPSNLEAATFEIRRIFTPAFETLRRSPADPLMNTNWRWECDCRPCMACWSTSKPGGLMSYRPNLPASIDAPLIMSISTRDIQRLQQQGGLILVNTVRPLLCDSPFKNGESYARDHCDPKILSELASSSRPRSRSTLSVPIASAGWRWAGRHRHIKQKHDQSQMLLLVSCRSLRTYANGVSYIGDRRSPAEASNETINRRQPGNRCSSRGYVSKLRVKTPGKNMHRL
jgi:hypothetical protein